MKMDAETTTETAVGFSQKFEAVRKFCTDALTLVVTDSASHRAAGEEIVAIREHEKTLDAEYKAHPVIIEAKRMQADKTDMAEFLESTRKILKRRQMDYEDAEEKSARPRRTVWPRLRARRTRRSRGWRRSTPTARRSKPWKPQPWPRRRATRRPPRRT
jgi:hypothetical protein